MTFLAVFGLLTTLFILATLFTSLTEEAIEVTLAKPVAVGTPEFKSAIEGIVRTTGLSPDTKVRLFNDGRDFAADLIQEIDGAEHSVTITNYIFREGEMTNETFAALERAARRGVEVRLLIDAHGANKAPKDRLEAIEAAGGKVDRFRPASFRTITRIHRRTHMRAIVIDGRTGYTGGLAFNDEWLGDGVGEKMWRDLMFKYEGPLAKATQDQFNGLWRQTNGEILSGPAFYPPLDSDTANGSENYFVSLLHAPAPDISADLLDLIWLTVQGAQKKILLATPYLTPPKEIVEALTQAVKRGVEVEILVPGPYTDTKLIQSATRSYYEELLEAGVKVYEYQSGRFHEKFLVADGQWSLIGSANMDNRSASLNVENVFGIKDRNLAANLEAEFEANKANAMERTTENFRPNIFKKAYYRILVLFAKQF